MQLPSLSRRSLLAGAAAALSCGHPKATGFRGLCFVANRDSRSVGVIDLGRFRQRKQIPLPAAPSQVIAPPGQSRVFVLAPETGTVFEIDAAKLAVSRTARAANTAIGMQLAPDGKALWVLSADPPSLVEVPLSSMQPGKRIRLADAPRAFDLGPGPRAAIASLDRRAVTIASLATGAVERTIETGDEPSHVMFRKDGRALFVASRPERALDIFDTATGRVVVRLPLPVEPLHLAIKPDGGQLFISGAGMDAVTIVYVYQTEIAETLLAGRAPAAMTSLDAPAYLLVANPETDSVTVLDLDNNGRLVASVQVGQSPQAIVMTPAQEGVDQYALVLNEKSGDVAVIRLKSLPQDAESRRRPTPVFTLVPSGEGPVSAAVMSFT